jgi:undecaprenyl-diphosphatase
MPLYQAIVLAIVQGLTEFLPVSSTAHLWLVPWIMKWKDPGLTFDVALHAGTLVAVLLYFWRYWLEMIKMVLGMSDSSDGGPTKAGSIPLLGENRKLFWFLVIATIPGGIAGFLFERAADEQLRTPLVVGTALILVGLVMWAGERMGSREVSLGQVSLVDSIIVGVAQAFAVIPGVSRSGSTMAVGLFRGMNRETAARFSFLLATPLVAGACLKKGMEIHHHGLPADMHLPFIVGIVVSTLVGYAVIAALIRYLERQTFTIFVVYRVILGVVLLAVGWGLRH